MVVHILADGSVKQDITGHIVRMEQATGLYRLLDKINESKKVTK